MRREVFLIFVFACFSSMAIAQSPEVEQMRLTSNPAYVVLGVEPTNIERPSTPREFIAGIQGGLVNGKLKPNFAMELNPLIWGQEQNSKQASEKWFVAADYLESKNWWENFRNSFGISIATSGSDTTVFGSLQPGTGLSYGMKVMLFSGRTRSKVVDLFVNWEKAEVLHRFHAHFVINPISNATITTHIATVTASIQNDKAFRNSDKPMLIALVKSEAQNTIRKLASNTYDAAVAAAEQLIQSQNKNTSLASLAVSRVPFEKTGFMLELAGAGVSVFENNEWGQPAFAKGAIWLTPSYKWDVTGKSEKLQSFDLLAVLRGTFNNAHVDSASYLDFGAKIQYNIEKFSLSAEGVARWADQVPFSQRSHWTYRAVGNVNYTLMDNITLKLTFGTNLDGNTAAYTSPDQMLAIAGLDFGILK